jgi:hypothetical protein
MEEDPRGEQSVYKILAEEWGYLPIVRFLTFGYNKEQVVSILDSIPSAVSIEFKRILKKIHKILSDTIDHQESLIKLCKSTQECSGPCDFEPELWKEQNICGFMKITYNPLSQEPLGVHMNDKMSEFIGVSHEDMLNKIADCTVPLPYPEADFFCLLIHETKHSTQSRTDRFNATFALLYRHSPEDYHRYLRICSRAGDIPAELVCTSTVKIYDAAGRVHQVVLVNTPCDD